METNDKIETNGNGDDFEKEKIENIKSEAEERSEDESEEDEEENGNDQNDESSSLSESDGSESENRFVVKDPRTVDGPNLNYVLAMQSKAKMTNQILKKILKKQLIL